jgi:two-component system CheB/CheR fusion protein
VQQQARDRVDDDLQNLIAVSDVVALFTDGNMALTRFTPQAASLFSLLPGDIGRSLFDIAHRLDYPQLSHDAAAAVASSAPIEREVRSNDSQQHYQVRIAAYRTAEDRVDGVVLTFLDITRLRQAEERASREAERMRLVACSTRDFAIITLDLDGRVTTWNLGAERIFGWSEPEAIDQMGDMIFTAEDRQQGVPDEEMRKARIEGRAEDERWHRRKDGSLFYCSGIMTPLREGNELRGYGKIARDLTGKRRADMARDAALEEQTLGRAQAQAAAKLKDEFLAVLSHELKNPLNLIQLNAELLARLPEAKTSPSLARAAAVIQRTVLSQAQIIDDLLDLSRIKTGKLAVRPAPTDLSGIVKRITAVVAEKASTKGVELTIHADPLVVYADPVRAEQVVWNLAANAVKFTPAGGQVDVRLHAQRDEAVLEVSDTGVGISPEFLSRVFDMFEQDMAPGRPSHGGMGVGLALVKHIVELHGGSVSAASAGIGRGSRFTVRWPIRQPQSVNADAVSTNAIPRGLRVLVVEDDAATREALASLLSMEGALVVTAANGREALAMLEQHEIDIVFSDISMPEMDGYEFISAVKANSDGLHPPVIGLTGLHLPTDAKRLKHAGFASWLAKPVTLDSLAATLQKVLCSDG